MISPISAMAERGAPLYPLDICPVSGRSDTEKWFLLHFGQYSKPEFYPNLCARMFIVVVLICGLVNAHHVVSFFCLPSEMGIGTPEIKSQVLLTN